MQNLLRSYEEIETLHETAIYLISIINVIFLQQNVSFRQQKLQSIES